MMFKIYDRAALVAGLILTACASAPGTGDLLSATRMGPPPVDHAAVLTHPDRPAADFADDAARRPSAVLAFTGIDYGMTVIELEAGSGYYTELFAHTVGPAGKVYMQNPQSFDGFFGQAIQQRLENRLANTQAMRTDFDALSAPDNSADLVTWFLGPHELWFRPEGARAEAYGSPDKAFEEIVRVLKPGGTFVVIDHAAKPGSPPESGHQTHRIDPEIVKAHAVRAGLSLVETSDLFANPADDYMASAFDAAVSRKTDRFIYKFRKAG